VTLNRVVCPECGAGLKSPTGFAAGQTVCCPKCETYFTVGESADGQKPVGAAAAADDDEDDRPRKRQKDDTGWSYKNSWLRYAVLGVLLCVLGVLGYMLYDKKMKEGKETTQNNSSDGGGSADPRVIPPGGGPVGGPNGIRLVPLAPPGAPGGGPIAGPIGPKGPRPDPDAGVRPTPVPGGGGDANPLGGLFGGGTLTPAEADAVLKKYKAQIVGTWKADLGDGTTAELVYGADGKVTETLKSPTGTKTVSGQWSATGPAGRKGLLVAWTGGDFGKTKPQSVIFEDDEMQHPVASQPGVVGVFRKK
jgi:hypothetical protein